MPLFDALFCYLPCVTDLESLPPRDHAYGAIYSHPGLSLRQKQLLTIAFLVRLRPSGQPQWLGMAHVVCECRRSGLPWTWAWPRAALNPAAGCARTHTAPRRPRLTSGADAAPCVHKAAASMHDELYGQLLAALRFGAGEDGCRAAVRIAFEPPPEPRGALPWAQAGSVTKPLWLVSAPAATAQLGRAAGHASAAGVRQKVTVGCSGLPVLHVLPDCISTRSCALACSLFHLPPAPELQSAKLHAVAHVARQL